MNPTFLILLVATGIGSGQVLSDACCQCDGSSVKSADTICLTPKEMRSHVDHIEPLHPSGLGTGLNLAGTVVVEIRFGSDGKVACSHVKSGHPIAISAAMEAIPKWTFKPEVSSGAMKGGCGLITIKYKLRDHGSSTALQ